MSLPDTELKFKAKIRSQRGEALRHRETIPQVRNFNSKNFGDLPGIEFMSLNKIFKVVFFEDCLGVRGAPRQLEHYKMEGKTTGFSTIQYSSPQKLNMSAIATLYPTLAHLSSVLRVYLGPGVEIPPSVVPGIVKKILESSDVLVSYPFVAPVNIDSSLEFRRR